MSDPHDPGWEAAAARSRELEEGGSRSIPVRGGGEIRVGTASWTDPTMTAQGVFYPADARTAEDRLRFYATCFSMVEADTTYYALPQAEVSRRWVERTPAGF